jgi:ribonuclease M5
LTDPDFAGEKIRARLGKRFPNAKHAYLSKEEASRGGDIGVENARPENILQALEKSRCAFTENLTVFHMEDLIQNGLTGTVNAAKRRDLLGAFLGIGYGNAKTFLARLNAFGVTREEFSAGIASLGDPQKEV